jgi:hypothetical protein
MVDNLFLQFCRITDPEGSGDKKNLTANYITNCINWPHEVRMELEQINTQLMTFRVKIEKARSKRVAYIDLDAQVSRLPNVGKFDPGEDLEFLNNLQDFVNVAYGELHGGNVRPLRPPQGDAYKLIRAMEKATLYERCYRCSEGLPTCSILKVARGATRGEARARMGSLCSLRRHEAAGGDRRCGA